MEPVGHRRTVCNPATFRRNLAGFLVLFGLVNVMLIVLYPQVYSGDFFTQLNPTSIAGFNGTTRISKLQKYMSGILGAKNEHRSDLSDSDPENELDKISNSISSITVKQFFEKERPDGLVKPSISTPKGNAKPSSSSTGSAAKTSQSAIQYMNPEASISKQMFVPSNTPENLSEKALKRKKTTKQADVPQSTTMSTTADPKATTSNKLSRRTPTKESPSNLTQTTDKPTASTFAFQETPVEEPSCKTFVLSEKGIEYTTKKYTIHPEITQCKDQKAPPHELCKVNETKGNDSYTNLEIKCNFSVCDRTKKMSLEYMDYQDGLVKELVIPEIFNNSEIAKLVLIFAEEVRQRDLPFLFVNCTDAKGSVVAQMLTFLPALPTRKDTAHQSKININVFLVDSVSRLHFYRSFPKTVSYLNEIKNDSSYPAHVFNFELFQSVHGHTQENERALFNGSLYPVHIGGKTRTGTPVNLDRLYEVFKKAGFQTMFLDDLCWRGHWGIMDKYKVGSWKSLQEKLGVSSIDSRGKKEYVACLSVFFFD